ncbi:thiol-disulfide oxidoreductase DCC family protein [Mechercharimyces sp. CAU 1602]|uniref:thiol-disulfide oxidoreductase DCC family protein n=1 Tax=Mechercharimyces sp. CAU 1602 TaxID=2973933 RepID=UPI002163EB24|nr:DCC1-like thiol-disulfide oxidoreductase family protein [Mechercharimyces sp. CAU 1602]MCS1351942.1 DCC1-like thiol-disulfide oxidoreductase family protein [Mechercharimyces sp. CAU 1602]
MIITDSHAYILYDGECGLCHALVQFVIPRDRQGVFRFISLQSDRGRALLRAGGLDDRDFNTFVLIDQGKYYIKSEAALRVAGSLQGMWKLLRFFYIVPRRWRDSVYDVIARYRQQIFPQPSTCKTYPKEWRERILE